MSHTDLLAFSPDSKERRRKLEALALREGSASRWGFIVVGAALFAALLTTFMYFSIGPEGIVTDPEESWLGELPVTIAYCMLVVNLMALILFLRSRANSYKPAFTALACGVVLCLQYASFPMMLGLMVLAGSPWFPVDWLTTANNLYNGFQFLFMFSLVAALADLIFAFEVVPKSATLRRWVWAIATFLLTLFGLPVLLVLLM